MRLSELARRLPAGWQRWFNLYLFLNVAGYSAWQLRASAAVGPLLFTDIAFAVQNLALCAVILLRHEHRAVDSSLFRQSVALAAFFSGVLLLGQPQTSSRAALEVSKYLTVAANILGLFTILNLGRSFGILIAVREVRTTGLYSLVRHPMYATDMLLRLGYLAGHPTLPAAAVVAVSVAAYYWRARFEEEFLSQEEAYREYMRRVRCRFIPFIF